MVFFGLYGFIPVCALAAVFALRAIPSHQSIAALMDARLSGGGLIMASESDGTSEWRQPEQSSLTPRWNGRLPGLIFLASVLFLFLAAWVPLTEKLPFTELPLQIEDTVSQMETQIDLLKEIQFIEEQQAEEWSALMRALQQESNGSDPSATWEALDQLSDRIQDAVAVELDTRRFEVRKREELLAALKAALQAYEDNQGQANAAMKELSDLLNKAAENNPNLDALLKSLPQFGMQQMAASCLTPEEARMLAERLSKMTQEDLERMQQLLQQGLCQSGQCQRPSGTEALKKFLSENPGCTNLMICAGIKPCNGWGVNRGPGTAPISWLGETSEEHIDFTEQVLTAAKLDSLANSEIVGESYSAPEIDPAAVGSAGGVLNGIKANDSAATIHTVLPRHRHAVDRFFERKEGK